MHPETESVGNESSGFNLGHVESEILDSENLIKFLRIIEFGKLLSDRLLQLAFHGSALYSSFGVLWRLPASQAVIVRLSLSNTK